MEKKLTICFAGGSRTVRAPEGMTLLEILRREKIRVAAPCGGHGACGKCRVILKDANGTRRVLACRTLLREDAELSVDSLQGGVVTQGFLPEPVPTSGRSGLGAAVDLGTTTIAVEIYDLSDGRLIGRQSAWNAQAAYGADVITRIQYTIDRPNGLGELQELVHEQIGDMIRSVGPDPEELQEILICGNTVMQHICAGLDPRGLASAPYAPVSLFTENQTGRILFAPCVASYVGGDITAGLLASGLHRKDGWSLFLDIGTNGEMALGGKDGFLCCAVASGPAFEGVGITCGMAGTEGAVSRVCWDGDGPEFETVGNAQAQGICGSGLIDLLAVLVRRGIVSATGRLLPPDLLPEKYDRLVGEDENGNGIFSLTPDKKIFLSARDVRQLQLAKAAVAAGIRVLLQTAGITADEVDSVVLAGGFGSFLDPAGAAAIGMLPAELEKKTVSLGNTSLSGARAALLDLDRRRELREIQAACRYLDLSSSELFMREYPEQMFFYEEEESEWN